VPDHASTLAASRTALDIHAETRGAVGSNLRS
jgi:hypothetical protein